MNATPELLSRLRQAIADTFNAEELKTLCSDLGLDYDDLGGDGKEAKIRELIAYLNRRGELARLVASCKAERPTYSWPQDEAGAAPAPSSRGDATTRHLQQQLTELQGRYETLSKRIAALNKDLGRTLDSEAKLVLEERRQELVTERTQVTDDMTRIERQLSV